MKAYKSILFLLVLYSYFNITINDKVDISNIYNGLHFDSNPILVFYEIMIIACYCLYIHNEFETYMNKYGAYVITRNKSRGKMLWRLTTKLLKYIIVLEIIKITIYSFMMIILCNKIHMYSLIEFLKMLSLNLVVYTIILFTQMILEIYIGGKLALVTILSYYLINIGLGTILYGVKSSLNIFLLVNFTMKYRLDLLTKEFNLSYGGILIVLILIGLLMFFFTHKLILRKDII